MLDIDKKLEELEIRKWLLERIKAFETSQLKVRGLTLSTSSDDGIYIDRLIEVAREINVPIATYQRDDKYCAYMDVYDHQFYTYISENEYKYGIK